VRAIVDGTMVFSRAGGIISRNALATSAATDLTVIART
jgi:hypothetical protein